MKDTFELNLIPRNDGGKGASRRLRREGMVPGIIYGASLEPEMVAIEHNELVKHLEHEAFFSHILSVQVEGGNGKQQAVIKDLQRHPARPFVMHFDLQRVSMDEELRMTVPLHFIGEDTAAGVKMGGTVLHGRSDVEIVCLPKDLPEYIGVDVSALEVGDAIHLSELVLPGGVSLTEATDEEHDPVVVSIEFVKIEEPEEEVAEVEEAREVGEAEESAAPESAPESSED